MAIPGFVADFSLLPSVRVHPMIGVSAALGDAGKVVPQQLDCLIGCQLSWSDCLNRCSWWEWVIGSCPPKCRIEWLKCVRGC